MKILHLNSNHHKSSIYKNMILNFKQFLNDEGHVYFPTTYQKSLSKIEENIVIQRNIINKFDFLLPNYRAKKIISNLEASVDMKSFNYILSYSLFSNGYTAHKLSQKHSISNIVIVQNTDVNLHLKLVPFSRKLANKIFNNAAQIVFISESYKDHVIDNYVDNKEMIKEKSSVIPFGIEDFWKKNTLEKSKLKSLKTEKISLLFVGKINKNKNVLILTKLVKLLNEEGIDTTLNIVGEIQDKGIYEVIRKSPNVNYKKYIEDKLDLLNIYRENDIFIMPSFKESFGLVYAEAMTQGLPVIYTEGQGFDKHFAEGEVGYSVNPNSTLDIFRKILLTIENYEFISQNCIEKVNKFYWENICYKYASMFACLNNPYTRTK